MAPTRRLAFRNVLSLDAMFIGSSGFVLRLPGV